MSYKGVEGETTSAEGRQRSDNIRIVGIPKE